MAPEELAEYPADGDHTTDRCRSCCALEHACECEEFGSSKCGQCGAVVWSMHNAWFTTAHGFVHRVCPPKESKP